MGEQDTSKCKGVRDVTRTDGDSACSAIVGEDAKNGGRTSRKTRGVARGEQGEEGGGTRETRALGE